MPDVSSVNRTIPIPSSFPVQWDEPDDAQLLWMYNPAYFREAVPLLDFELWIRPPFAARNKVLAAHGVPTQSRVRQFNGYVYNTNVATSPDATSIDALTPTELTTLIGNLKERWFNEWLPEIKTHLAAWEGFALDEATLSELILHLDGTEASVYRLQEIHIELSVAMFVALHHFEQAVVDLTATATEETPDTNESFDFYALLSGFETRGMQSSHALWQLSRLALIEPEVYWVLYETPVNDVLAALAEFDEGQEFLVELHRYLQEFGYQGEKNYLNQPSWREDPIPVIQMLRAYLTQSAPEMVSRMGGMQRESAMVAVQELLADYPQPLIEHFNFLLEAAQTATWLREEHPHWLDLRFHDYVRQVVLAVGRHLEGIGTIAVCDDIFYLSLAEIRSICAETPSNGETFDDFIALIAMRRTTLVEYAACTPPPMLGVISSKPLPTHPLLEALSQNNDVVSVSKQASTLQGHSASSGLVRGRAKVLHSTLDAAKLKPGDIMVTVTTDPSWTPLYANIAGLVTDMGGVLSHAAVVAREFGIPAAVGVGSATTLIKDGQLIEVNGNTGMVCLDLDTLITTPAI